MEKPELNISGSTSNRAPTPAARSARAVARVAGDHPFLVPAVLALLANRTPRAVAHVPETGGRPAPLVAVYDAAQALPPLARRLASGRFALTRGVLALDPDLVPEAEIRAVDPDLLTFVNVNDSAELERARRLADGEP